MALAEILINKSTHNGAITTKINVHFMCDWSAFYRMTQLKCAALALFAHKNAYIGNCVGAHNAFPIWFFFVNSNSKSQFFPNEIEYNFYTESISIRIKHTAYQWIIRRAINMRYLEWPSKKKERATFAKRQNIHICHWHFQSKNNIIMNRNLSYGEM